MRGSTVKQRTHVWIQQLGFGLRAEMFAVLMQEVIAEPQEVNLLVKCVKWQLFFFTGKVGW